MLVLKRHRDGVIVVDLQAQYAKLLELCNEAGVDITAVTGVTELFSNVTVTVCDIRGDKVRLGIEAPKDIPVHREEVYWAIKREGTKK